MVYIISGQTIIHTSGTFMHFFRQVQTILKSASSRLLIVNCCNNNIVIDSEGVNIFYYSSQVKRFQSEDDDACEIPE